MRRLMIQWVVPTFLILIPFLAAGMVILAIPVQAMQFFLENIHYMEWLILGAGGTLFVVQMLLAWRALRWRGTGFDDVADRWINHLAQSAEWFPMLGLLGTVAGILQTFDFVGNQANPRPADIIRNYAPAITATGAGLFMAFINILPPWIVIIGRDLMLTLGGQPRPEKKPEDAP